MTLTLRSLLIALISSTLLLAACSKTEKETTPEKIYLETAPKILTVSEALQAAISGEHRSEKNKARDEYRNPAATLEFLGVKADSTVVELWPGGGWYAEILAPFLKEKGTYYAANFGASASEYRNNSNIKLAEKFSANPEIFTAAKVTALNPPTQTLIAPSNTVDYVLTFRNVHNWVAAETEQSVYTSAFNALKPGGIFGVVEHRGTETDDLIEQAKTGYVSESHVIEVAESVGFKLIGRSEINGNPKDTKDYANGVWTLPPSLRLKDVDKEKYLAIGESDRMTLKFQKPK